jgi:polysaccharide export outer membrane protein
VIQEKDILHVMAFDNSPSNTLSLLNSISEQIGFSIREGLLRLPNLQPILVQGLTLAEATQKIEQTYTSQFPQIQIFLNFKDRPHNKVELAGLVSIPEVIADGKLRLFETLSKARIGLQANLFKSYLIRQNQMVPVDFYKLLKEGDMSQNIVMKGGDKIYIANASDTSIMVLGEVGQEGIIEIPSGFMSLRQAIASAGGISYTGRRSYIQIIRGHLQHPKIYTVSWDHVIHLPSDSLLLIPGDIVYIAATPITEWNRFMTQLLPTLVNINLLSKRQKNIGVNLP